MVTFIKRIAVLLFVTVLLGSAPAAPVFPVKYSANSRYLVDQNDTPFPIMGRTAWFVTSLSPADARTFVDDTAARDYSVIELHIINHDPRGNHPPFDGNGNLPFLKRVSGATWDGSLSGSAPDFTTPNEPYWSAVDGFLSYCESKGLLVLMFPAYVGYAGGEQGWMQEMVANGTTKMQSYGTWIATRYKNQKNLVWMMGGDMGTFTSAQTAVENALLTGLKSVTGQQSVLFTAEWNSGMIATDQVTFGSAMTLNGFYDWSGNVNGLGRRAYARNPVMPAFLLEEPYDEEGPDGNGVNGSATQPVRRFQWWGWLSSIGGYVSGNGYIWPFPPTWKNHLDTQGTRDMTRLNAFMGSIAWYELVPSGLNGMRTLITAGGSSEGSSDYVAAAATPDGTLLVAYVPPAHNGPITVDMGAMSGPTRARWFDATSAAYVDIGTGLANTGSRAFTTPGNNSVGTKDWVLVLDNGSGPAAPTISDISNQATTVNTPTTNSFTINDADTPISNLTLSAGSSNPTLVTANNVIFGGSGMNRTVTVNPAANQIGTTTITVTVNDGTNSASDTFVLTVNAVNTPPTITAIADQTINEDTTTAALDFTIGDAETVAGSLILSKGSSNPGLVTTNNITFGGSGANRTVTVNPVANQSGTATITVTVSDGQYAASTNFVVTVSAVNDPPTITGMADQTIIVNGTTGPLNFMIWDVDTAVGSLSLSGNSSNPTLLPANNIVFGGSGTNRTVTLSPASNQTGSATITVGVSDGQNTASMNFVVTVSSLLVGTQSFTNTAGITIPSAGKGTPYPSTINVSGIGGAISNVAVTLRGLSHSWGNDIDVLLVGPGGQKVTLMSDAGTGGINNANLSFSNVAAGTLPATRPLVTGTYRPTDYSPADTYPSPAPAGPYGTNLAAFNGTTPNGTWSLYVYDDGAGDQGSFAGGWSLALTTVSGAGAAPTISDIADQSTSANTPTAAIPFAISDADTAVTSLALSAGSSNPALVPTNNIVFGGSGSNRTVTLSPVAGQAGTATVTVTAHDGALTASDTFVLTVNTTNTPPTMTGIADRVVNEDTSTGPLGFTVGDPETAAASLTLSKGSSNPTLVPVGNIVFGGSGANRTVTVTPVADQSGTVTITVNVSDSTLSMSTNFAVTVNAVNDSPTITGIANQTINKNTSTGPLSFAVGDVETPAASLTLSKGSSNPTLVPASNIVFGGSGANRTVTITPAADQTGTATIAVGVSDGALSVSTDFVVTVNVVNNPPMITGVADQTIDEDTSTVALGFTVGDAENPVENLTLSKASSNPALVPVNNIVFGGSGSNRTVTVTPVAGQSGAVTITLSVGDGQYTVGTNFVVTVNAVNDAPTISSIANQTISVNGSAGPLGFTIVDVDTSLAGLTLNAGSSNPALVPTNNIAFGGSGSNRTVTVTSATNQTGTATISVSVSEGQSNATASFLLTVNTSFTGTKTFTNPTAILIPSLGSGTPYPSTINVSGMSGVVSNATVTLNSISHQRMSDIDILLVGPGGQRLIVLSDVGPSSAQNTITLTLSDAAASSLGTGTLVSGTYKPTNITSGDTFPAPAPAAPYGTALSVFNGQPANGAWSLYLVDDSSGSTGSIAGGWSLTLTTVTVPPTITGIPNQAIPVDGTTGPLNFTIGDLDTTLASLTLSAGSSNPALVPTNNIVFGGSGSNRTVTVTPAAGQSGTATVTVTVSDGLYNANSSFVVTVSTLVMGTQAFTNTAAITIPDAGKGTPYPSTINVSGMAGTISNVTVTLRGLSHTWGNDIDVLLVGPAAQKVTLLSDAGTGGFNNANLTFSDGAAGILPATGPLVSGTYRPTDYSPTDTYPSPAPAGPYATTLSSFNGQSANGAWSLYVYDDGPGDQGSFASGWSITITTVNGGASSFSAAPPAFVPVQNPPKIISITLDQGTAQVTISGEAGFNCVLEASSDLVNWTKVAVQENTTGTVIFNDQPTTNSMRFYRAMSMPQ